MATLNDFLKLDIRVGEIIKAENFPNAKKPAYKLWINFGDELGIKKSSAQITEKYDIRNLIGTQVLAVVNLNALQVADFISECLILGVYAEDGVILIKPERIVKNGDKLG